MMDVHRLQSSRQGDLFLDRRILVRSRHVLSESLASRLRAGCQSPGHICYQHYRVGSVISADLCMSPCSSDYIITRLLGVSRVVVEEPFRLPFGHSSGFLLIVRTTQIFTLSVLVDTPDVPAYSEMFHHELLRDGTLGPMLDRFLNPLLSHF